jgi:lipocalin
MSQVSEIAKLFHSIEMNHDKASTNYDQRNNDTLNWRNSSGATSGSLAQLSGVG